MAKDRLKTSIFNKEPFPGKEKPPGRMIMHKDPKNKAKTNALMGIRHRATQRNERETSLALWGKEKEEMTV